MKKKSRKSKTPISKHYLICILLIFVISFIGLLIHYYSGGIRGPVLSKFHFVALLALVNSALFSATFGQLSFWIIDRLLRLVKNEKIKAFTNMIIVKVIFSVILATLLLTLVRFLMSLTSGNKLV